ncbi:hypothetical protein ACFVT1_00985 [Streptomyces sp. NPDC057963]|uniref:hypothetical protein n=1 Tax=Streptomyces sp. NPDC057963 TaxID=3346290 RepID=UPI0036E27531
MRRPPAGTAIPIEGLTNEEENSFLMDTQQISAPPRTPSPVPEGAASQSGVMHINSRHTTRFTVVGNHLAQHRELSLLAIGLATHIQSLPTGAKAGIKTLTERFPESEARIAAALRELEAHGYLKRTRERLTHLLPPPRTPLHQPTPLQNCNLCDRAFRSPTPGNCRDCASGPPLTGQP